MPGGPRRCSVGCFFFFFSSRRRHTRYWRDWSSDVCSSDLARALDLVERRVGVAEQVVLEGGVFGEERAAERQGQGEALLPGQLHLERGDRVENALRDLLEALAVDARQDGDKFVAAVAPDHVVLTAARL